MTKEKLVLGAKWLSFSFLIENGIQFLVNTFLTRILDPTDFGIYGLLIIVVSLTQVSVECGLSNSLLRRDLIIISEYNSVFFFQLFFSIIAIIIIIIISPFLISILKIKGNENALLLLTSYILFYNMGNVYRTYAQKTFQFNKTTIISITSLVFSSIISLLLAIKGFGIYSLVYKLLIYYLLELILLLIIIKIKINIRLNYEELKKLISFGYKLTISNLLYNIYSNYYYIFIGNFFSIKDLGYYYKAEQLQKIPSNAISNIISKLFLPYLAINQKNLQTLSRDASKIFGLVFFWGLTLSLYTYIFSSNIILVLFGIKWDGSIIYFKIFSFLTTVYLLNSFLLILMMVLGYSGKILIADFIKFSFAIPLFFFLFKLPIHYCIYALIIQNIIYFLILFNYISKKIKFDFNYFINVLKVTIKILIPISIFIHFSKMLFNLDIIYETLIFTIIFIVLLFLLIILFDNNKITLIKKVIK